MSSLESLTVVGVAMAAFGGVAVMPMRVLVAASEIEKFLFVAPFG